MPIWSDENYMGVLIIASIPELETLSGRVEVRHIRVRQTGDIEIALPKTGKPLRHISEASSYRFESRAMLFAHLDIPFSGHEWARADFIAEGLIECREQDSEITREIMCGNSYCNGNKLYSDEIAISLF